MSLNMWQLIWTGVRLERLNEWTWQDRIDTGMYVYTTVVTGVTGQGRHGYMYVCLCNGRDRTGQTRICMLM